MEISKSWKGSNLLVTPGLGRTTGYFVSQLTTEGNQARHLMTPSVIRENSLGRLIPPIVGVGVPKQHEVILAILP